MCVHSAGIRVCVHTDAFGPCFILVSCVLCCWSLGQAEDGLVLLLDVCSVFLVNLALVFLIV